MIAILATEVPDMETYFCIDIKENFDLRGPYGSKNYHQFLSVRLRGCNELVDEGPCLPEEEVESLLKEIYMDIRTLHFRIDHMSVDSEVPEIFSDRIPLSNTVFKKTTIIFSTVNYTSDFGFIFQNQSDKTFNQVEGYINDTDLRKYNDPTDKNRFKTFFFLNLNLSKYKIFFVRNFMKAQTLLANIGGVIKGLQR